MKKRPSDLGTTAKGEAALKPSEARGKKPLKIPPLLLEGDEPPPVAAQKTSEYSPSVHGKVELPASYGTGSFTLMARDPHSLYAHWDLTPAQQAEYKSNATNRQLLVRLHLPAQPTPAAESALAPDATSTYLQAEHAGSDYSAELGYYHAQGDWVSIARSNQVRTPPDQPSPNREALFAAVPPSQLTQQPATITPPQVGWIPVLQESESEIMAWKQFQQEASGLPRTEAQKQVWAELVSQQSARGTVLGSFELSEWGEVEHDIASFQFGQPPLEAVSSFFGQPPQLRSFWFNVNAELIIYGATEPTATVTIAGQSIELRPDGSFSVRLAFPDGDYELEVAATSVDNELRRAKLKFRRCTEYSEANPTTPC